MNRTVILATKTLDAINKSLEADQGATYRQHLKAVLPHIGDAYRGKETNPFRSHMGASVLGNSCARAIWYNFRWSHVPSFKGQTIRLFNRGHLEEGRFIALLLSIGVQVYQQDENGNQFRISDVGGHLGGSGDGIAIGIPELEPGQPCLLEFKTHNDKSFEKLVKEGVRDSKFVHYVQMNIYMHKMAIPIALYGAVNKNNDALYLQLVPYDRGIAEQFIDRGRTIILSKQPPDRINNNSSWYECSWCEHKPVCHLKAASAINCRTCSYVTPHANGNWYCAHSVCLNQDGSPLVLDEAMQLAGCSHYENI